MKDLEFEQLLAWMEGQLPADEAAQMAAQVESAGPEVKATVAWLQRFFEARQSITLVAPPERVRRELSREFARRAQAQKQAPGLYERLAAVLRFDSHLRPTPAGARSTETGADRQLFFSSERLDFSLALQPEGGDRSALYGQLLPQDGSPPDVFSVQLMVGDEERAFVMSDELGEFILPAQPIGEYEIVVSSDTLEVRAALSI